MDKNNFLKGSREMMVREQLLGRGIRNEKILDVFRKLERHKFVDSDLWEEAYSDHPLSIGYGQTISQPYIVALMTEALDPGAKDIVLEIGSGSGYQTAILATLVGWVYSIERINSLAKRAEQTLKEMGYKNFTIGTGDGTLGWEEFAPFDKIMVTAASPSVPHSFIAQLKVHGKMVIPVGGSSFVQSLQLIEKITEKETSTKEICGCTFVPLIGQYGWRPDARNYL